MKRKILAALLTLVMVFSLLPVSAWAEETTYSDVAGHWAQTAILRWSDYGVLQGSEGKFSPDGTLTRGQMAVILSRLLNLPAAPSAGFTDVAADAWYADGINRCAAAGILQGSEGKAMPEDPITREQAMVMLCRALGIAAEDVGVLAAFSDLSLASDYARPYVAALVKAGVVKGDANGLLNPLSKITRAEIVTMIDRLVGHYAKDAGAVVDASDGALVIVVAENVKIVNAPAGTKIIVAEKATGLTVNGTAVSADQTYIVPEEETKPTQPTKPSGGTIVRPEHRHSYAIKFDQDYHWEECACGAVREKHAHVWTEKVTTAATCTEAGEKTFTCVCGATKMEAIPATGHSWGEPEVTKAATCTEPGEKTFTCVCGATKMEEIPATGHSWGEPEVTYAANGQDGEKVYTCTVCSESKKEAIAWKFNLTVTSESTVDVTVGEDYTAVFTLPKAGSEVDASGVTVEAKMKNVESLGVDGERSHSVTVNTGIQNVKVDLSFWLKNCYGFESATVNATIGGKACTYDFAGNNGVITATTDTEAARAAWKELTSHITANTHEDDSFILVKNGSTLQIGSELLCFEENADNLKLDNFSEMAALIQNVQDHVKLETANDSKDIEIVLKAGTQLAVGSSIAELKKDATITITGVEMPENFLSSLRAAVNKDANAKVLIMAAVQMFDQLVGQINGKTITVNIAF